jgi:predicted glycosyltransferase
LANILIDLGHPAHPHIFRNAARIWQAQGHQILFATLDRDIIVDLVTANGFPYRITYRRRKGRFALPVELVLRTLSTLRIARQFEADLLVSFGNPTVAFPAWLLGKPSIGLTDTEHAKKQHALFKPFTTVIATPTVFQVDFGPRQVRYAGYHELAYLHPDVFTPDPSHLESLGLQPGDRFFIVRFVAWRATHDVGQHGFTLEQKRALLRELAQHGKVLLSVEDEVDAEFADYVTRFPPEIIHHLLAYAAMYVGEGGTMASEAAVLGTPSIYVNTLIMGYILDLQDNYDLLTWCTDGDAALAKVRELLAMPDLDAVFADRREKMLIDKINPTPWLVDLGNKLLEDPTYRPADHE